MKALAHWGAGANQGIVFPSFGWVPSSVVSETYSSGGTVTLTGAYLSNPGAVNTMTVGGQLQMSTYCTYSDGSTTNCSTLDIHGNVVTAWASSNPGVLTINSSGLATGVAIGTANITATVTGGISTNAPYGITVSASPLTLSGITLSTAGG